MNKLFFMLLLTFMILPASAQEREIEIGVEVEIENGLTLFENRCGLCHRENGTGTYMLERRLGKDMSILERRQNLSQAYLNTVVRWGIGSMPRFSRAELSDVEMSKISDYLLSLP